MFVQKIPFRFVKQAVPIARKLTDAALMQVSHPSDNWLYGSNRGHDSIAIFEIDDDGRFKFIDHESTHGHWPRHFALDLSGSYLYVENRRSDSVIPFEIESEGRLTSSGQELFLRESICRTFVSK